MDVAFAFAFFYFSCASTLVVGNTVLVVSPAFLFLLIKSVRAAVPLFTKRSFYSCIGQIGNSFLC
jgi:hypothetical protein